MRVGINARVLVAPQMRGWTRYAIELLRHLPEFGAELVLFSGQSLRDEYLSLLPKGSFRVVASPPLRYVTWEQAWLPFACARERVEVLHAPANYGLPLIASCPRVLTLHDAIDAAFDSATGSSGFRHCLVRTSFWAARRAAKRIITVSEHAKADIAKHYLVPEARITAIHEASDLHERVSSANDEKKAFDGLNLPVGPFLLYAGGFDKRKNVEFLIDAFRLSALDGVSLVLVGSNPPDSVRVKVSGRKPGSHEVLTGFVSDIALAALYRRALAFVYPSLYEGFGLQLCEAMSFGCPTLASNATSLPEVLGDGGATFSPVILESLSLLLRRVASDCVYRQDLVRLARARSAQFSWRRTARLTYDVYRACR